MAERQVRVAVVMDDTSYVAGGANVVSTNTKIATSTEDLAAITKKTADAQVAAILKVREASKLRIANLQSIAANAPNYETQTAATVALQREQTKLARSYGVTTVATGGLSKATKTAEGDVSKLTRGALAGTGVFSSLGRSLAFASNAFIGLAVGAEAIKGSIGAAEALEVAQRQVNTQLKTSGKSWQQYGTQIDAVLQKESALSGFTKTELLQGFGFLVRVSGNVQESLKLTAVAADVARARNISLSSASIALGKALGGSETALKRLGITIPKTLDRMQALEYVQQKFAGQASAGATVGEKFHAVLVDTGATIGQALLPTFVRLTTNLSDWLEKMNESGKLTKDVNEAVKIAGVAFHALGSAIKVVDDVTGSFKNTLEALAAFGLVRLVAGWAGALEGLAAKWGLVADAANTAAGAQERAVAAGGAGAAGAATPGGLILPAGVKGAAAAGEGAGITSKLPSGFAGAAAAGAVGALAQRGEVGGYTVTKDGVMQLSFNGKVVYQKFVGVTGGGVLVKSDIKGPAFFPSLFGRGGAGAAPTAGGGPFGSAQPLTIFKSFTQTIGNQLAQAQAALTKSTADDVAAAKAEIAFIKREIASGHLAGASLVQALQAEASAVGTVQSAQAAAIQKQTAAIQASIDPIKLEVNLSRAQALGQTTLPALRALRAAAQKAIASGKLTLAEQKQAYDQITSLNSQIKQAVQSGVKAFTEPLKLQIALAREQAFGGSTTATLEAMKRAALKAVRSGKYTGQALIDLYNEIASINQQLGTTATAGLGKFKQLNLDKTTAGLGLTPTQRKALQARLSQVGPGGTVPGSGTGAYGYSIGRDDRPVHVHTHISIDGKKVADNTTRHQQIRRRRNSSQRRGPVAGG